MHIRFVVALFIIFAGISAVASAQTGEKQVLAGARAGFKLDAFGFFFKVRPGLVHFGGAEFTTRNGGSLSTFATDIGGVFEYYVSPRVALRLDWGDTMIYFPNPIATAISPSKASGWYHNLQASGGVSFRFWHQISGNRPAMF